MSKFLVLFRAVNPVGSPEEMQQQGQKWMTWMKALAENGHAPEPGQPLERGGKVVERNKTVTDGPYAEKDLVGSYMIMQADDLDQAAEVAKGCPIFEYGGFVEVRPIMKMDW